MSGAAFRRQSSLGVLHTLRTGQHVRSKSEVLWQRDDTPFAAEYTSSTIESGSVATGAVVSVVDINFTGRKHAQDQLAKNEEFLRMLLRSFPNGSVNVVDRDGPLELDPTDSGRRLDLVTRASRSATGVANVGDGKPLAAAAGARGGASFRLGWNAPALALFGEYRAYLTLSAVIFCGFIGVGSTGPFQALYAMSLGASLNQVALITGVYSTVALAAALLWGRLADRRRQRKPFVLGAMAGLGIVHVATASVGSWHLLVPLRLLEGVASGAHQMASLALMGDLLAGHPRRGRLVSGYRMSGSLAFSVAIVASGWVAQTVGFRGSYLLAAGVYAVAFLIALTIPAGMSTKHPGAPERAGQPGPEVAVQVPASFGDLLRGPMRPLLVLALAYGLPFAAVYSVWPIWVATELGHGHAVYAQLWGLAAFVEVPCMLLSGVLIDRVGRRRTFMLGLGAFAFVYMAYLAAPPLPGLIAAQVLRGFAFAAFTATALTMAIELAPADARGRAAGLYQTATGLAQISGNWIGAPLAAVIGFRALFGLAAAAVMAAALYARLALRQSEKTGAST